MKKRILSLMILSSMAISIVAPFFKGHENINKTDVAAQEETTNSQLYAGISKAIYNYIQNNECTEETTVTKEGWTTTNVNIRKEPNLDSEILDVLEFNTYIEYSIENDEWAKIEYNGFSSYINRNYIGDTECSYIEHNVPLNEGFKSYLPYNAITNTTSDQYKIQLMAYTGNYGIRQVVGRYCVAIGTAFNTNIGTYFDLILENGVIIPCIVGDIKADIHTEPNNIVTASNGCLSEFIVDLDILNIDVKTSGNISNCDDSWDSQVVSIKIYDKNIFE